MTKSRRFSPEVREGTVRLVREHQGDYDTQWAAITSIASKFGCAGERDCGHSPGERMSIATNPRRSQLDHLTLLGGFLMIIDTVWGAIFVLPFDWTRLLDIVVGISLLIGLPAYVLDVRRSGRLLIFLPVALLFRWSAISFAGSPPTLARPWTGNVLLIVAILFLQWSKLRRHGLSTGAPP